MISFNEYLEQAIKIHTLPRTDPIVARGYELAEGVPEELIARAFASFNFDSVTTAAWGAGLTLGYALLE